MAGAEALRLTQGGSWRPYQKAGRLEPGKGEEVSEQVPWGSTGSRESGSPERVCGKGQTWATCTVKRPAWLAGMGHGQRPLGALADSG